METHKEQLSPPAGLILAVVAVTATVISYRVTQYVWLAGTQKGGGATLGAEDSQALMPRPFIAENLPAPTSAPAQAAAVVVPSGNRFYADNTVSWHQVQGSTYPYVFSVPTTLTLFPLAGNGPDTFGAKWNNETKIVIGVGDLSTDPATAAYVHQSKRGYVENWWKQFSGFNGLVSVAEFITAQGLKGYRATYSMVNGSTPDSNVFFEIPDRPELIIRMTNSFIDPSTFDRMVDSVGWVQPTTGATPLPTVAPVLTSAPTTTPTIAPTAAAPTSTPVPTPTVTVAPSTTETPTP